MKYLILLLLTSCAANPYKGIFNMQPEQDSKCMNRIGAMAGYCEGK